MTRGIPKSLILRPPTRHRYFVSARERFTAHGRESEGWPGKTSISTGSRKTMLLLPRDIFASGILDGREKRIQRHLSASIRQHTILDYNPFKFGNLYAARFEPES